MLKETKDTSYRTEWNEYTAITLNRIMGVNYFDTITTYNQLDSFLIIKDSSYLDSKIQNQNGKTNFTFIEVPIRFAYKILDTKKFDINISTGTSIGFLIQNKGYFFNGENIEKAENNKIIFNYLLSTDFMYNVSENVHISLSPQFKYNINNHSTLEGIKRKYYVFGINAGLVLDF